MTGNPEIHISLAAFIGTAAGLAGVALLLLTSHRNGPDNGRHHGEPNWSVPAIDAYADLASFFHDWDARLKIAALFLYSFAVASLHSLFWSLAALIIAIAALIASHLPLRRALTRLAAMSGFLAMFLIIIPFTAAPKAGETLIFLPALKNFPFHVDGFFLALTIVIKACTIALMMEPLLGTARLPVTLQALSRLGLPDTIGQMVLLTHRYIFVFLHEMKRMYRGMRVRGFAPGTNLATLHTMGNFFGMLFVRSFDRTQRVYDAMLSRGYNGRFPTFIQFRSTAKDWAKGGLWVMIGLLLLLLDRIMAHPFN